MRMIDKSFLILIVRFSITIRKCALRVGAKIKSIDIGVEEIEEHTLQVLVLSAEALSLDEIGIELLK